MPDMEIKQPACAKCSARGARSAGADRHKRKERIGVVVTDAMNKTIVVRVGRRVRHPMYGKEIRLYNKFYAHDEKNAAKCGNHVRIVETRPLSRLKRWRLVEVLPGGAGMSAAAGPKPE